MIPVSILYLIIIILALPYIGIIGAYLYYKKKKKNIAIPLDGEAAKNNFLEYFNNYNHGKEESHSR